MNWKYCKDEMPPVKNADYPHLSPLWVYTEEFGGMVGFYSKGEFWHRYYACKIVDPVIAWIELPTEIKKD